MGSTRPAPSAAEIVAVLERGIPKGKALGYGFAINLLRRELRTSSKKAAEWLNAATREEPHEFELVSTVSSLAWDVSRGDGTSLRLDEAGYASTHDENYWPQLTARGEFVSKDGDADGREFVVLSKDLRAACKRAHSVRTKAMDVRRRLEEQAEQGAEERHGKSLAYFRGLLKMAGLKINVDNFRTAYNHSVTGEYTALNINLFDGAIDAVAEVLAANGIEPEPPTQIITRKPLQEATE